MATGISDELKALYGDASKHSAYQSIPTFVSEALGYSETIDEGWRGDRPRLRYLLSVRQPGSGELWGDFGANTGFFTLSLAHRYPTTRFVAIEANPNHSHFVKRIADHFGLTNVEVMDSAIGLEELHKLPKFDFMLHLNVLHHAGHDFDCEIVHDRAAFPGYAIRYLRELSGRVHHQMLFQLGSNWGGDKAQPLIGPRDDAAKLRLFSGWLTAAGWQIEATAYPSKTSDGTVEYWKLAAGEHEREEQALRMASEESDHAIDLDVFPGEFYRRPLFLCSIK